jgi:polysaccharide chain length determinant protein (PEP-CTERM system associated)
MNVEGDFSLQDVAGLVRRRGKVAAFTTLFVVLASYWVAMALPNTYTSYATVLVEPQSVDPDLIEAGVADSDLNERLHLMTAQILSRARLSSIIDEFGLYEEESEHLLREEVIDLMLERIRVNPVLSDLSQGRVSRGDQEISEFQISVDDYSPSLARDVAQRLSNDFIESHIADRIRVSQKSLDFINSELEGLAERIAVVDSEIKEVKNANPGMNPEEFVANQRRLERTMADLAVAQREFSTAMSDVEFYRSQAALELPIPNDDASPARRRDVLKLSLAELKSRGLTDKHPDVVKIRAELVEVEELVAGQTADGGLGLYAGRAAAEARRAEIRAAAANEEVARIREDADGLERLIIGAPAVAERLDALMRDYEHLGSSFQDFSNRQLEATVQAQLERRQLGEQFRVLEAAFIAPEPSAPNRILIIALGIVLGLAMGGGTAVLLEATDTSAHDARSLQTRLQLPVLVSIPQIWLESDRIAQRRARIRTGLATAALVVFALVGGAANHVWVNGLPGFVRVEPEKEQVSATEVRG